ncbi:MAG: hypothetical protein H0T92_06950 [Pyrinomonadaceae bacterium]|nr:hypothetical protein [Pyrinomonadaceae bacterium]
MNSVSMDSGRFKRTTDSRIVETIDEKTMQNNAALRKQVEDEQSRSQATTERSALEWQMTFDAIESPVLILDLAGRVVRLNQAAKELSENTHTEVSWKAGCFTSAGLPWQNVSQIVQSVRETGSAVSCQATDEVSGTTWNITANIILGTEGDDERIILVAHDVTRSVELEASLRRSEVMSIMGSLVANVAHEVRNPLFAISSVLDAFEARFQDQADYAGYERYTRVLREELGRLNELMEELLDYGKPPQQQLYRGSIGEVVAHAIRSCMPFAEHAEVKIINNMSDELPPVMMCRRRLPKVFSNLIKNAVQYSPPQSTIVVEAQEAFEEGQVWIDCTIKDCGPGFRDEDLPRIFEPFFTKRRGGTGLGLSIAQRIMEEHGGRICAGNRPEGGAFMVTRFPVTTSK